MEIMDSEISPGMDGNKLDLGWKEMCLRMETNFALLWKEIYLWMETNFDLGWKEMCHRRERNLTWDEWVLTHMQISNVGNHG
jgi:hypothetical protein